MSHQIPPGQLPWGRDRSQELRIWTGAVLRPWLCGVCQAMETALEMVAWGRLGISKGSLSYK